MDRAKFAAYVNQFFSQQPPCENAPDAKEALLTLYDYILEQAQAATSCVPESPEWYRQLVRIQQVICWTPLRLFLLVLATDSELPIRAGAKGELADRPGHQYWGDPEVEFISRANLAFMMSPGGPRWPDEAFESTPVQRAQRRWQMATQGVTFTPLLTIRDLSAEADE